MQWRICGQEFLVRLELTIDATVVVASVDTFLHYTEGMDQDRTGCYMGSSCVSRVLSNNKEENNMVSQSPDVSSLAEVLDRILDKGIVVDVWARVSIVGIELLTIEARVVVASVDTFLHYAEEITKIEQAAIGAVPA